MKIGILGYGSIGRRHADNAKKLGHEVIVYDPMLQHNDVKFEREVYDQAVAVVIATPSTLHEAGLRACVGYSAVAIRRTATGFRPRRSASPNMTSAKSAQLASPPPVE